MKISFALNYNKYRSLQVVKTISGQRKLILGRSKHPSSVGLWQQSAPDVQERKEGRTVMLSTLTSCGWQPKSFLSHRPEILSNSQWWICPPWILSWTHLYFWLHTFTCQRNLQFNYIFFGKVVPSVLNLFLWFSYYKKPQIFFSLFTNLISFVGSRILPLSASGTVWCIHFFHDTCMMILFFISWRALVHLSILIHKQFVPLIIIKTLYIRSSSISFQRWRKPELHAVFKIWMHQLFIFYHSSGFSFSFLIFEYFFDQVWMLS